MKQATIKAGNLSLILGAALSTQCSAHAAIVTTARERTHLLLLSATYHADKHGDVRPLVSLLATVPDGSNKAAIARWMKANTAYDFKATKKDGDQVYKNRPDISLTVAKARDKAALFAYFNMPNKKAAPAPAFSVKAYIKKQEAYLTRQELTPAQSKAVASALMSLSATLMPVTATGITPAPAANVEGKKRASKSRPVKLSDLPIGERGIVAELAQALRPELAAVTSH